MENTKTTHLLFKGSGILYFWLYFGKSCKTSLESPKKSERAVEHAIFWPFPFFQISNSYCQKSYNGFRVFLGSSTTSQIF